MKKHIAIVAAALLALSACGPIGDSPANPNPSYPNPSYPNPSYPNPSVPMENPFAPKPADAGLLRSEAYLETSELRVMESYPLQFALILKGSLPTPCHHLRAAVSPPDAENRINVEVYSVANPDEICIQILQPFEASIPLGSFPAGRYTLWVNGNQVAEFEA